ncbi:hypothetical protein [Lusitaniella coriacea]|uniref:hypothetical protein n=1 Tax=Lusitaniella coriacea TaxID=1983105 RepID=UPI003CF7D255
MKPLSFIIAGATTLGAIAFSPIVRAGVGWSYTYHCREYTITLSEYATRQFSYLQSTDSARIQINNGFNRNTGRSWIYSFRNGRTVYELEDVWGRGGGDAGSANLVVYRYGKEVLRRNCRK